MSWLSILAIIMQMSDAAYTCQRLRTGGEERNPLLGRHPPCIAVVGLKGAALLTIPIAPKGPWRLSMQIGNIGSGVVGIGLSVVWRD